LLEEWISKWRPILIAAGTSSAKGIESGSHAQEYLFVDAYGRPLDSKKIWLAFTATTYKFTGVALHPHLVRTIWATEYIKSTKNYIDAAYMLGDTVETVLKTYAKLLDADCGKRASEWVTRTLNNDPTLTSGNGA
jgi:site-specific recombinase XerC